MRARTSAAKGSVHCLTAPIYTISVDATPGRALTLAVRAPEALRQRIYTISVDATLPICMYYRPRGRAPMPPLIEQRSDKSFGKMRASWLHSANGKLRGNLRLSRPH
jgi:hypothetical protein